MAIAPLPGPTAPSSAIRASVSTLALAERKDGFQLLRVGADIAAGQPEHRRSLGDERRVLAGVGKGLARRLDDVAARAGEVGADVGRPALAAPDDVARRGRKGCPATRSAAIDAEHKTHGMLLLAR